MSGIKPYPVTGHFTACGRELM